MSESIQRILATIFLITVAKHAISGGESAGNRHLYNSGTLCFSRTSETALRFYDRTREQDVKHTAETNI